MSFIKQILFKKYLGFSKAFLHNISVSEIDAISRSSEYEDEVIDPQLKHGGFRKVVLIEEIEIEHKTHAGRVQVPAIFSFEGNFYLIGTGTRTGSFFCFSGSIYVGAIRFFRLITKIALLISSVFTPDSYL